MGTTSNMATNNQVKKVATIIRNWLGKFTGKNLALNEIESRHKNSEQRYEIFFDNYPGLRGKVEIAIDRIHLRVFVHQASEDFRKTRYALEQWIKEQQEIGWERVKLCRDEAVGE